MTLVQAADRKVHWALPLVDPETVEVGRRRKDVPIWDRGWILAILAGAIAAEWMLRRRWGYA